MPVTRDEGLEMAATIGASKFLEVSALARMKLNSLFNSAASIALAASVEDSPDQKGCAIM